MLTIYESKTSLKLVFDGRYYILYVFFKKCKKYEKGLFYFIPSTQIQSVPSFT